MTELADAIQRRQMDAEEAYRAMVVRIADDVPYEMAEVEDVGRAARRELESIAADVELLQRRREWARLLAEKPGIEAARDVQQALIDRAAAKLKIAQQTFDSETAVARATLATLERQGEAKVAERELRKTARQDVKQRLSAAGDERQRADDARMALQRRRIHLQAGLETAAEKAHRAGETFDAAFALARIAEFDREIAAKQQDEAVIVAVVEAVMQEALQP